MSVEFDEAPDRDAINQEALATDHLMADLEYVANWSLARDVGILARTLRILVHANAY